MHGLGNSLVVQCVLSVAAWNVIVICNKTEGGQYTVYSQQHIFSNTTICQVLLTPLLPIYPQLANQGWKCQPFGIS